MNYKVILSAIALAAVAAYFIVYRKKRLPEGEIPTEETVGTSDIGTNATTFTSKPQIVRNVETAPFSGVVTLQDNNSQLNVRSTPDLKGNIIAKLPQGKEVYVVENAGDWYGLTLSPFAKAYVNKNYIVKKASQQIGDTPRPYANAAMYDISRKFNNCCI